MIQNRLKFVILFSCWLMLSVVIHVQGIGNSVDNPIQIESLPYQYISSANDGLILVDPTNPIATVSPPPIPCRQENLERKPPAQIEDGALIWYQYHARSETTIRISPLVNAIVAYEGTPNNLTVVSCWDSATAYGTTGQLGLDVYVESGKTYYLMMVLTARPASSPIEGSASEPAGAFAIFDTGFDYRFDDVVSAKEITILPFEDNIEMVHATRSGLEPVSSCIRSSSLYSGRSIWYQYKPQANNYMRITTSAGNNILALWQGDLPNLTELSCTGSDMGRQDELILAEGFDAGKTYYVEIINFDFSDITSMLVLTGDPSESIESKLQRLPSIPVTLDIIDLDTSSINASASPDDATVTGTIEASDDLLRSPNDSVENAIAIESLPYRAPYNNIYAVQEDPIDSLFDTGCRALNINFVSYDYPVGNTIWYTYTPTDTSILSLDVIPSDDSGSGFNLPIALIAKMVDGVPEVVNCSNGSNKWVGFQSEADETYYIGLGWGNSVTQMLTGSQLPPNFEGFEFELVDLGFVPENRTPETAEEITQLPYSFERTFSSSFFMGTDRPYPSSCTIIQSGRTWYTFTPEENGLLDIRVRGIREHEVGFYVLNAAGETLTCVYKPASTYAGSSASVLLDVVAGDTYQLVIGYTTGEEFSQVLIPGGHSYQENPEIYTNPYLEFFLDTAKIPTNITADKAITITDLPYRGATNFHMVAKTPPLDIPYENDLAGCQNSSYSAWYTYTPTETGILTVDPSLTDFMTDFNILEMPEDVIVMRHIGAVDGATSPIRNIYVEEGVQLYFHFCAATFRLETDISKGIADIRLEKPTWQAPLNFNPERAEEIVSLPYETIVNTKQLIYGRSGYALWYSYTALQDGYIHVDIPSDGQSGNFGMSAHLVSPDGLGDLIRDGSKSMVVPVRSGERYYFRVSFSSDINPVFAMSTLLIEDVTDVYPTGADFESAMLIPELTPELPSTQITIDTALSSVGLDEYAVVDESGTVYEIYNTAWLKYTPTRPGTLQINLDSPDFASAAIIWQKEIFGADPIERITSDQNNRSIRVNALQTYYIQVGGQSADSEGNVTVDVSFR